MLPTTAPVRLFRSVLYIPASKLRAMEKAGALAADAIIFDLEDAVIPDEKPQARAMLAEVLSRVDYRHRTRIVRINGLESAWGREDALAFADHPEVDAILIPKVNRGADLDAMAALAPGKPLWVMLETALGYLNAAEIAAHKMTVGMVMGTNDLAKELGARFRADRLPLVAGLGLGLLAARAHGRIIVDGVFNAYLDDAGLEAECGQGRDMGFDGKTLIHPAQLAIANRVYAPSEADVIEAGRQIAAFRAAAASGQGVAVLDGKIIENLHIVTANAILAKAGAIAANGG